MNKKTSGTLALALALYGVAAAAQDCAGLNDVALVNGQLLTVDADDSIADALRIRGNRITEVGDDVATGPCTTVIDLEGRTVTPGLIDSHIHFLRAGLRPGHDIRWMEQARDLAELQAAIRQRALSAPEGEMLSAIGRFDPRQLAEGRLPSLVELDNAAPNHPVYLQPGGMGGAAATNSVGKTWFADRGVPVGDDGSLEAGSALPALMDARTVDDKLQSTLDLMHYANATGLTMVDDQGGTLGAGTGWFDPLRDYDYVLALWRDQRTTLRIRQFFMNWNETADAEQAKARVDYAFMGLGNNMYRIGGLGERFLLGDAGHDVLEEALMYAAQHGWTITVHAFPDDVLPYTEILERVHRQYPIDGLRWTLAHVFAIGDGVLPRLNALGAGITAQNQRFYNSRADQTSVGPPFKTIVDSRIPVGGGTDATQIAPISPWFSIYFMVTGKNVAGDLVNDGQQISRENALRLYTMGSAWQTGDDDDLGSIEVGKIADLVVLSDDFLAVAEEDIKQLRASLTMVGGRVVFSDGSVVACTNPGADGNWHRFRDGEDAACRP